MDGWMDGWTDGWMELSVWMLKLTRLHGTITVFIPFMLE